MECICASAFAFAYRRGVCKNSRVSVSNPPCPFLASLMCLAILTRRQFTAVCGVLLSLNIRQNVLCIYVQQLSLKPTPFRLLVFLVRHGGSRESPNHDE